ncbi:MAG: monofunctional biosynthetic peptidoglycan transglycosylase [Betaproteobacteria bacterium]|nr:monofunctional biosynthetic peptidoglycan transglycosylase [Betaproteobacteria bacterium]
MSATRRRHSFARFVLLCAGSLLVLQAYFLLRIALWAVLPVHDTAFMRAAQLRMLRSDDTTPWRHDWTGYDSISPWLKRSVVASEDATFLTNPGVDWKAIREAWMRDHTRRVERDHRIVGGSTITQQLAKNLFLSPERSYLRKGQELVITGMLELVLDKRRILEMYLNSVEWGDGVYGAQAAAQQYFHVPAARLTRLQAARLAVMLPAPRLFQHHLYGPYIDRRTSTIAARAEQAQVPR